MGVPAIAPAVRDRYALSLALVGTAFAAYWLGSAVTLLLWGLATDRFGERVALAVGLGTCGALVVAAAFAPTFAVFAALLAVAGAAGASVNSASGRAVMYWFGAGERGLALGLRQTAIPVGGLFAAAVLPWVERSAGFRAAFLALGGLCLAGAVAGALVLRESRADEAEESRPPWSMRDQRLWRLSLASSGFLVAQVAVTSFVVLFLHDERGFSAGAAAAVLAGLNVVAIGLRVGMGRWSDLLGARIVPLRRVGAAIVVSMAATAVLLDAPAAVVVAAFVVAGALSMAWNGLSFTAAAELAGRARTGAALGIQQTILAVVGVGVPPVFATVVEAASWQVAFGLSALAPLAGWWALRPLEEAASRKMAP